MPEQYSDAVPWLVSGLQRQRWATLVALLGAWSGAVIALWFAAAGVVVGALVAFGAIDSNSITRGFWSALRHVGGGTASSVVAAAVGAVVGAVVGFVGFFTFLFTNDPIAFVGTIVFGTILAIGMVVLIAVFEGHALRMRGYRRPSRDEVRRLAPHVQAVGSAMGLTEFPRIAMADLPIPGAWTHLQHVVLSTSLLNLLDDGELEAVLAHELHHWRNGDAVGLRFVWACGWPIAVLYNIGIQLSGRSPNVRHPELRTAHPLVALAGWLLLWPTWVLTNLVIAPLTAATGRQHEYDADAAAAAIGRGPQLASALRKLSAFEPPRSGWEQAMMAHHPPTELRIDAVQGPQADDDDFLEGDLGSMPVRGARRLARTIGLVVAGLLVIGAIATWRDSPPTSRAAQSGSTPTSSGGGGPSGAGGTLTPADVRVAEHQAAAFAQHYFNDLPLSSDLNALIRSNAAPGLESALLADATAAHDVVVAGSDPVTGIVAGALSCDARAPGGATDALIPDVRMDLKIVRGRVVGDVYVTAHVAMRLVAGSWRVTALPDLPDLTDVTTASTDPSPPSGFVPCP